MTKIKLALLLAPFALVACDTATPSRTMSAPTSAPMSMGAGGSPSAQPSVSGSNTMSGSNMGNSAPVGTGRQTGTSQR